MSPQNCKLSLQIVLEYTPLELQTDSDSIVDIKRL